jgi:hypothetical protein
MVLFRKVKIITFSEYRKKPDIIGNEFMLSGFGVWQGPGNPLRDRVNAARVKWMAP